ncbi:MAG: hypothetical protein M3P34_06435 [Actinomycetota bacterium]|nr:hypothetical protein [Actinomycetota bacterium]
MSANTGEATADFRVTVEGPAAAWAPVEPPTLTLAPGEEAPAWVCFHRPGRRRRAPETCPSRIFRSNRSGVGDLYVVKGSAQGTEVGLAQVTSTAEREIAPVF